MPAHAQTVCTSPSGTDRVYIGLCRMVDAWNSHTIPRKGVPNILQMENNGTTPIISSDIPTAANAVAAYRGQGGRLTEPSDFGEDPLSSHPPSHSNVIKNGQQNVV